LPALIKATFRNERGLFRFGPLATDTVKSRSTEGTHPSDLLPAFRTKLSMISAKERGEGMSKSRHSEAQIIGALKQLEAGTEGICRSSGGELLSS
jgi:hypothetical protein